MLAKLTIKNVALIEEAEIEFMNGLNVLSGETGSGKTVIINAINFALGAKESDRGMAMHEELKKLGGSLNFGDNTITVPKQTLHYPLTLLNGHNDHRIVMALSVILSQIGGSIKGAEAIRKSYPGFFNDILKLGAEVEIHEQ